jgi:dTDP-4-amino-4,6-dideoxygalactose transaminase
MAALPMYEEMIVTGAWWDFVDVLAKHRVGGLLRSFAAPMRRTMLAWSRSDDLWKRGLYLPSGLGLTRSQVEEVVAKLAECRG